MMMTWPATPDKSVEAINASASASSAAARVAVPDLTNLVNRSGSAVTKRLSSAVEPSPASTYGETIAGDSVPPTPAEDEKAAGGSALYRQLRRLQLEGHDINPLEVSYAKNAAALSPTHEELGYGRVESPTELPATEAVELPAMSSPMSRHQPAVTSPGGVRRRSSIRNSGWRNSRGSGRSVSFVLPPRESDPFFEYGTDRAGNALAVKKSKEAEDAEDSEAIEDAESDAGSEQGSPIAITPSTPNTPGGALTPVSVPGSAFRPREDREVHQISGDNAQALFPPNACVFVANLVQSLADDQLEFSVTKAFEQFGKVYVKIKRDPRGMPYAFCQYENVTNSEKAIQYGRGVMIDGRQCRTERAKVNRSLYLSRVAGGSISEEEAREILTGRGDLEKLWHPSATDKEMFRLQDGIWVMFAYFQDCRDAQALFKDSSRYRLEQPPLPEDIQARLTRGAPSPARPAHDRNYGSPAIFHRNTERGTLWIGNLPPDVTQASLRGLFACYGQVRSIEVISRALKSGPGMTVFAYVEFSTEEDALKALNTDHVLNGHHIRVELKDSPEHAMSRQGGYSSAGSPHPRRGSGHGWRSNPQLSEPMNRVLTAGLDTSAVWNILYPEHRSHVWPQGMEHHENQSHVAVPPGYGQIPYQNTYYPHPYITYGVPSNVPANSNGEDQIHSPISPIYSQSTGPYPAMTLPQYQYQPAPPSPYYAAYPSPSAYSYPTRASGASGPAPHQVQTVENATQT